MHLQDALELFRRTESRDQLAPAVDRPDLIRAIAAWRSVRWDWTRPKRKPPKIPVGDPACAMVGVDLGRLWLWVWSGGKFDLEGYAAALATSQLEAELRLSVLAQARIVYPDATVTAPAEQLIDAFVNHRYPKRAPGRPKGSKNRPKE